MNKKSRQFSVVIHNVRPDASPQAVEYCQKNTRQFVQAVEAYPKPPGHHLHLFLQYPNQRSKRSVLKEFEKWKPAVLDPAPVIKYDDNGIPLTPGRVQIDQMRGRFSHCHAYLNGETKFKPTGDVAFNYETACYRQAHYNVPDSDRKPKPGWPYSGQPSFTKRVPGCANCRYPGCLQCLGQCCQGCRECDEKKISGEDIKNGVEKDSETS